MTREIMKFRAWDEYNKNFSYWTMNDLCNWQDDNPDKPSALEEWTQSTGLHDKNGKEIWGGDLLKCKAGVMSNESVHGPQKVEQEWIEEVKMIDGCWMCRYYLWEIEDREVIGNVFQNKNLIN